MTTREAFETLEVGQADGVLCVELARPERVNAINKRMCAELAQVVERAGDDASVRVVLFTGRGRAFCAGADITELAAYETVNEPMDHISLLQRTYNALEELEKPTIAAIHGFAYGGGLELALACDFRVVARDALLGVPEIGLGLLPRVTAVTLYYGSDEAMEGKRAFAERRKPDFRKFRV